MPPHDMIKELQQAIGHGGDQVFDVVPTVLRGVLLNRSWADRRDRSGQPFHSFEAFVTHILWQGLESTIPELLLYCRKHSDVAELVRREVRGAAEAGAPLGNKNAAKGKAGNKGSSTTIVDRGATYALRRLKRDHPELADKVVTGKMSAHAAAIEAGFRKPMISVPADPDGAVAALIKKFGYESVATACNRRMASFEPRRVSNGR